MKANALFYPYINVPESTWISQQLLYLDRLGSIVPSDYIYKPESLTPYMRDLVSSELVQQILPMNYVPYNSEFELNFIKLIKDKGIDKKIDNINSKNIRFFEIHIEKFGDNLKYELQLMGLLKEHRYPWYHVEIETGILLMTYIASVIGMSDDLSMTPITNDVDFLQPFLEINEKTNKKDDLVVFEKIVPVPSKPIPVSELVNFKVRHSELLDGFREKINNKLNQVSLIQDSNIREYEISKFINESRERINEISRRIEEQRWGSINIGTLGSLTAATIPVVDSLPLNEPSDLCKAIPGLIGAAYSVYYARKKEIKEIKREPFAYASYIDRAFNQ